MVRFEKDQGYLWEWIMVPCGGLYAIKNSRERKGLGVVKRQDMVEFKNFVDELGLLDPPLLSRIFTWYRPDGSAMSMLDRFLLSDEWIQEWGVVV